MSTGKLRERVAVQTLSRVQDAHGGYTETWATSFTVWARVTPAKTAEGVNAGQIEETADYVVKVRYRDTYAEGMRISWRGRFLHVRGILNKDERREYLHLECHEGGTH